MPPLQTSVVNPLVRLALRLGLPDSGDARLETSAMRVSAAPAGRTDASPHAPDRA
jgi:hypothetical protein